MPAPLPTNLLAFIGRLVGVRQNATTVTYTTFVGYSSLTLLLAIAAIAVLSQVQSSPNVPPGATAELSG